MAAIPAIFDSHRAGNFRHKNGVADELSLENSFACFIENYRRRTMNEVYNQWSSTKQLADGSNLQFTNYKRLTVCFGLGWFGRSWVTESDWFVEYTIYR